MTREAQDPSIYPRDIPAPEGFPEGWKCVEKMYGQASKMAGHVYMRYASIDGKHKSISSPQKVFELHCQEHPHLNLSPDDLMARYQQAQKAARQRLSAERETERQERKVVNGAAREEAIESFRGKLGALSGPVVFAFPGWRTRWEFQPVCGQVGVTYTDPTGKEWKLLKDLECFYGNIFLKGEKEEADGIIKMVQDASTKADATRFAVGARTARETQTAFTMTMDGDEKVLEAHEMVEMRKSKRHELMEIRKSKKARRPRCETHAPGAAVADPLQELDPVGIEQEGWAASLSTCEEAQVALVECQKLLTLHWGAAAFPELIVVYGSLGARKYERRMVGVYRQLPEPFGGKACFQRLLHAPALSCTLGCDRIYILWSTSRMQWQVAIELADNDEAGRLAFSDEDVASPWEVAGAWQVLDGGEDFTAEPAMRILHPGA